MRRALPWLLLTVLVLVALAGMGVELTEVPTSASGPVGKPAGSMSRGSVNPATTTPPATTATTLPPETASPWPSLAYARPGVALVGVSPIGNGSQGGRPSQLYLSNDLVHWRLVTPPESQVPDSSGYQIFEHASFLNASSGWVTTWNPGTLGGTIYRTIDGGQSWTSVPGGGHGAHAGAAFWSQLLSPTTAFGEAVDPAAPQTSLVVTTDAGLTWHPVYNGPLPTTAGQPPQGPFEMPMVFADALHGFAGLGIPPAEFDPGDGEFFMTSDGGSIWVRESPPLPHSAFACPTERYSGSPTTCLFSTPTFDDPARGVLPAAVVSGAQASVAFDVTTDGGLHWTLRSQRSVTVTPNTTQAIAQGPLGYPLVSVASASTWWLLGWSSVGVTTQVSADAGAGWAQATAAPLPGVPVALDAVDATRALLTVTDVTPDGSTTQVLTTADGGQEWHPVTLPG